jgi:hypothetical protein
MSGDEQREAAPDVKPFRFKGSPEREARHAENQSSQNNSHRRHHRRHHHSRHRSKRHKTSHLEDDQRRGPESMQDIDPDQAFRESLFDALGDDEGANFWEGVYGQPIHKFPNQYIDDETGELETMNDDEYAQYVRRKMWEKSREGVEAAREDRRREKARERAKQKAAADTEGSARPSTGGLYNNFAFDFEIEESLRRGQQRRDDKRWKELWNDYLKRWAALQDLAPNTHEDGRSEKLFLRNKIAWPVESGKRKDVNSVEIERFIKLASQAAESDEGARATALAAAVKAERVRWHPDKIQQRYGVMEIDESTMKGVTATFQVLDRMWNDLRSAKR